MNLERLNELFSIVNEGYSSIQEREIRDYITNLRQENKQLKEQLQNISNEFLKYDWKNATQEQVYNQLKSLYESIFKEVPE